MCFEKILDCLCCLFIFGILFFAGYHVIKYDYLGM